MITAYDINFMENCVDNIINMWDTSLTIFIPAPIDQQINWNKLLHEYNGPIVYTTMMIPAERKFIASINDIKPQVDVAGDRVIEEYMYAIPLRYTIDNKLTDIIIDTDWIIQIDDTDNRYRIKNIKHRIGENIITISKLDGARNDIYVKV